MRRPCKFWRSKEIPFETESVVFQETGTNGSEIRHEAASLEAETEAETSETVPFQGTGDTVEILREGEVFETIPRRDTVTVTEVTLEATEMRGRAVVTVVVIATGVVIVKTIHEAVARKNVKSVFSSTIVA